MSRPYLRRDHRLLAGCRPVARCVLVIAVALTSALIATPVAIGSTPVAASVRLRPVTIYVYDAKVGVSGAESDTWTSPDPRLGYVGDSVQNSSHGTFTIDTTIRQMTFFPATMRAGRSGIGYGRATVNGTWSSKGTKITAFANNTPVTGPYQCGGRIGPNVSPQTQLSWKRSGSRLKLTLHALQEELYVKGWDSCPNDDTAAWMSGVSPTVYETAASIPGNDIGRKSFSAKVSGPLGRNRIYWHQNCPAHGTCSLAWQGSIRFTLKRKYRTYTTG